MEEFFENEAVKRFEEMIENNEELFFDIEEYEDVISYYLEIGDYQYAEEAIKYAQNLYPDSERIKLRKLEFLLEKEENLQAKILIRELENSADEDMDFIICCAKYYSNMGNPRKAINLCEKALEKEEDEDFIHNFIADEYKNLDDPFSALKHYQMALKHEPSDEYALESIMLCYAEMNRTEEALIFINNYLDNYPFSEIAWYEYGSLHFNNKNYQKAIEGFDYLLAINPHSVAVYANKAACYEALNEWEKAIETYIDSQEYEFTKSYSFYKIGQCYQKKGLLIPALNALQKSLHEDPQFHLSMMAISDIYEELGNLNEAAHFALEASRLSENNLEIQKKLAFLYISLGKLEEALICLKKMVETEPGRFYNWYAYAEVLMLVGDYDKAEQKLKIALKRHQRAELYYQLSNCYFNLKRDKDARLALEQALSLNPSMIQDMQTKYPYIDAEIKKEQSQTK
ncbi:tetratricopeptide repeat protein [Elizabethkingia argentiflava]|uniref:Tetratricopeptide repeat protein n=1 Tax=Elizabethkingia argenteiflava TaxID=2681556 RepID=A0A845PXA9_9FLAO|nr:tetratricopeptide repeat protein [Elizabethkingia argenteiflava]NAW51581.1 tetratricopeptide repeat protein [Elizabethkingia argenteiflava]